MAKKIELPAPPPEVSWKYSAETEKLLQYLNGQLEIGQPLHHRVKDKLAQLESLGFPKREIEYIQEQFGKPVDERAVLKRSPEIQAWLDELLEYIVDLFEHVGVPRLQAKKTAKELIDATVENKSIVQPEKIVSSLEAKLRRAYGALSRAMETQPKPEARAQPKPESELKKVEDDLRIMFAGCHEGVKRSCTDLQRELTAIIEHALIHPLTLLEPTIAMINRLDLIEVADDTKAIYDNYRSDIENTLMRYGEQIMTPRDLRKEIPRLSNQLDVLSDSITDYLELLMPKEKPATKAIPEEEETFGVARLRTTKTEGKYAGHTQISRDFKDDKTGATVAFYTIKIDPVAKGPVVSLFFRVPAVNSPLLDEITLARVEEEGWSAILKNIRDQVNPDYRDIIFTNLETDIADMEEYAASLKR